MVSLSDLRTGTIIKETGATPSQERRRLRSAIGTASLSASGTSTQEGIGDGKGSVKRRCGLEQPPTSEDGNASSSGFIFLVRKSALEMD
ncbi:hypothetical protein F2Q68_00016335 [Brassica cretica]|uniref:Uncharacterized protein n=1 Tax=Brassica cretica TaxID=69181 RepID=A0A8S9HP76_BRACR|nr:hypothetical protein F2Q68_00016335 [Brassica cretica]